MTNTNHGFIYYAPDGNWHWGETDPQHPECEDVTPATGFEKYFFNKFGNSSENFEQHFDFVEHLRHRRDELLRNSNRLEQEARDARAEAKVLRQKLDAKKWWDGPIVEKEVRKPRSWREAYLQHWPVDEPNPILHGLEFIKTDENVYRYPGSTDHR